MMTGAVTVMKTRMRMRTKSQRLSLAPSAKSLGAYSLPFILQLGKLSHCLPRITHTLFRKNTATKSSPVKTKSRPREMNRGKDDEDGGSGVSEPADSIMDSSSEEEADDEVDGMLGE